MSKWKNVHEEYLGRGDVSLTVFVSDDDYGDDPQTLFEVSESGIEHWYYQTAKEAVEGVHAMAIAYSCYGYTMLMWEHSESDEWLDRVWAEQYVDGMTTCEHDGSCEDQFIKAQKELGNE